MEQTSLTNEDVNTMKVNLTSDDSIIIFDINGREMARLSVSDDRPDFVKISTDNQMIVNPVCTNAIEIKSK